MCPESPNEYPCLCFHNGFISETLQPHFQRSVHLLFCCCYTWCGIVFLCQASTSLSLHPDGLACCTEPLLRYASLLMSWLGKQGWANAVKCQKVSGSISSDSPPTYQVFKYSLYTPQMFMLELQKAPVCTGSEKCIYFLSCVSSHLIFSCSQVCSFLCVTHDCIQYRLDFHVTTLEYVIVVFRCEAITGPLLSNHSPWHPHSLQHE